MFAIFSFNDQPDEHKVEFVNLSACAWDTRDWAAIHVTTMAAIWTDGYEDWRVWFNQEQIDHWFFYQVVGIDSKITPRNPMKMFGGQYNCEIIGDC
jgi:hypothetical protein